MGSPERSVHSTENLLDEPGEDRPKAFATVVIKGRFEIAVLGLVVDAALPNDFNRFRAAVGLYDLAGARAVWSLLVGEEVVL